MKITIDKYDHQIVFSVSTNHTPVIVGSTTRFGLRIKCIAGLKRFGWMNARFVEIEPEPFDVRCGHPALASLIKVYRGKRGRYPKAKPEYIYANGVLNVGVTDKEIQRVQRLADEIDRFTQLMKSRRGLRTVAVAALRKKAELKRQRSAENIWRSTHSTDGPGAAVAGLCCPRCTKRQDANESPFRRHVSRQTERASCCHERRDGQQSKKGKQQ